MSSFIELVQQFGPLFGILAAVATVLGLSFRIYKAAHDRQVRALQSQVRDLQKENTKRKSEGFQKVQGLVEPLQEQAEQLKAENQRLRTSRAAAEDGWRSELANLTEKLEREKEITQGLNQKQEQTQESLDQKEKEERVRFNLLKRAMRLEGRVWQRRVLQGAPAFRPLSHRHVAVLSVLNLKGGVGKTTVTAHLGAALAAKGYRVLLMDLDLQGSLSSLFINEVTLRQRSQEKRLLQHFLLAAAEKRKTNLLDCCYPIFDNGSAIVPSADSMAYAELNLTMHWLLGFGKRDTRFLLRKVLQQKRVTKPYDIVLLDCPPLFNTCCVNALAASDYVIVPVLPSRKAAERVPLLLDRLKHLRQVINPQLQVMGILLNRTHSSSLTAWEQDLWLEMQDHAKNQWSLPVPVFDTVIRQTTEVRDAETEFVSPAAGSELHNLYSRLVAEVEARLPGDCLRTAAANLGPQ